ncbi:MAG: MFS transporter [Candidatus Pacearchaeota archaeon]
MNKKLKLLILSDVLMISSFGLIAPIFAIFISENLVGGNLVTAGIAVSIFWIVRSAAQLPLSRYLIDKNKHQTRLLLFGTFMIILVPFIYLMASHVNTIFIAQAVYGLGTALAYPAWFSLFTTYMDKRHKGFEYSVWNTSIGIGIAISAFLGAKVVDYFSFKALFFVIGALALAGFAILIVLDRVEGRDFRRAERKKKKEFREREKRRKAFEKGKRRKQREKLKRKFFR